MSAFVEPGSDTSEPSFIQLLDLWASLPEWRRRQIFDLHGIAHGIRYPLSALLTVASVAELLIDVQIVMEPGVRQRVGSSAAWSSSERHVILEWPPRGRLAVMRQEAQFDAPHSGEAESG